MMLQSRGRKCSCIERRRWKKGDQIGTRGGRIKSDDERGGGGGRERELSGDPSKMDPEKIQETIGHSCQSHRSLQSFRFAFHAAPALQMARHCAPDILHCV